MKGDNKSYLHESTAFNTLSCQWPHFASSPRHAHQRGDSDTLRSDLATQWIGPCLSGRSRPALLSTATIDGPFDPRTKELTSADLIHTNKEADGMMAGLIAGRLLGPLVILPKRKT